MQMDSAGRVVRTNHCVNSENRKMKDLVEKS